MENQYFIFDFTEKKGPFSLQDLKNQNINEYTKIIINDSNKWQYAKDIPELKEILAEKKSGIFSSSTSGYDDFLNSIAKNSGQNFSSGIEDFLKTSDATLESEKQTQQPAEDKATSIFPYETNIDDKPGQTAPPPDAPQTTGAEKNTEPKTADLTEPELQETEITTPPDEQQTTAAEIYTESETADLTEPELQKTETTTPPDEQQTTTAEKYTEPETADLTEPELQKTEKLEEIIQSIENQKIKQEFSETKTITEKSVVITSSTTEKTEEKTTYSDQYSQTAYKQGGDEAAATQVKIPSYIIWSILNLILCNPLMGLIALPVSISCINAVNNKDYVKARKRSKSALILNVIGTLLTVIVVLWAIIDEM